MPSSNSWDAIYNNSDFKTLSTNAVSFLIDSIKLDDTLRHLDVGCGTGALCRSLYMRGFTSVGIDPSENAIRIAKQSVTRQIDCTFHAVDIADFHETDFSLITAKYMYRFVDNRPKFLDTVRQRLAHSGVFVIIDPLTSTLPRHKKGIVLPMATVQKELESYFAVTIKEYQDTVYYFATTR